MARRARHKSLIFDLLIFQELVGVFKSSFLLSDRCDAPFQGRSPLKWRYR
ncbi:MAG TPA: hypothetical protein V6C84_22120 [Coleofasciculaceae cyanobacterium]